MPLLDHFRRPLNLELPWEAFHNAWATTIAGPLNRELPPDYRALPLTPLRSGIEVDVGAMQTDSRTSQGNGTATAVWAPPAPPLRGGLEWQRAETFEVRLLQTLGGPQLRAAIELVSPANKDRSASRRAFAIMCAAYLHQGVTVIVIDVVTERLADLHLELMALLQPVGGLAWRSASGLSAIAYRTVPGQEGFELQAWPEALAVGSPLPTPPLWLEEELCLPLPLEESYQATCELLRIATPTEGEYGGAMQIAKTSRELGREESLRAVLLEMIEEQYGSPEEQVRQRVAQLAESELKAIVKRFHSVSSLRELGLEADPDPAS